MAFMMSISIFPKKYAKSLAIELARQRYCITITLIAYVEDYHTCSGIFN